MLAKAFQAVAVGVFSIEMPNNREDVAMKTWSVVSDLRRPGCP